MNDYRRPITADELIRQYDLNSLKKTKTTIYNQIKDLSSGLQSTNVNLQNFVNATTSDIENLQEQIDGNITTWFYNGVPTLQNAPANEWDTDTKKDNHLGDLYYDQNTGYSYRFSYQNNVYSWTKLTDSDITEALALANAAQDTADSKRRVFVVQPTPPYDVGDIWTNGTDLYRCRVTRASGAFNNADWILATNYTDDSYARGVEAALNSYKTEVSTTYSTKSELTTATDEINGTVSALTTRTETLEGEIVNKASVEQVSALSIRADGIESTVSNVSTVANNALAIANASVDSVDVLYALGTSSTTAPTSGWNTVAPAWEDGKYMWQKTVTTYGDSSTGESEPTCLTGATGPKGDKGDDADPAIMYHNATGTSIDTEDAGNLELKAVNELSGDTTQNTVILPSDYTQVLYIESNGNPYIDTGLKGNLNTQVEIRFNKVTNSGQNTATIFGDNTTNTKAITINLPTSSGNTRNQRFGDKSYVQSTPVSLNTIYTIKTNKTNLMIDNVAQGTFNTTNSFTTDSNLMLFRCTGVDSGYYSGTTRIYYCKIAESGTLKRYFIPCYRNSDNEIGMYDLANKQFYTTTTSTKFTKGANVSLPTPDTPIPIEVTTGNQEIKISGKNLLNVNKIEKGKINGTTGEIQYPDRTTSLVITENSVSFTQSTAWNGGIASEFIPVSNTTYRLSFTSDKRVYAYVDIYDRNKNYLGRMLSNYSTANVQYNQNITITDSNIRYFRLHFEVNTEGTYVVSNWQLEKGNATTTFEPYIGKTYEVNLGKNLLDLQNNKRNHNGINATYNNDGSITLNGTATSSYANICADISGVIEYGRTYILSVNGEKNFSIGFRLYYKDGTSQDFNISASGTISRVKPTKEVDRFRFYIYNLTSSNTYNATLFAQLEQDIVSTHFEKYFEPIELCKIGTYQDKIFKGKGINVLDFNTQRDFIISSGSFEINGNGIISKTPTKMDYVSTTPPMSTTPSDTQKQYVISYGTPVKSNTQYTFSFENPNGCNHQILIFEYDKDYKYIKHTSSLQYTVINPAYQVTTTATTKYLMFRFDNEDYNSGAKQFNVQNVMLEQGSTATEYEPYNAKDKWLLHKEIGKEILNSNHTWAKRNDVSVSGYSCFRDTSFNYLLLGDITNAYCTHFKYVSSGNTANTFRMIKSNGYAMQFIISNDLADTTDKFKIWITSNVPIVYYVLATPTTTEITNSELIKDLDDFEHAVLNEGINHIVVDGNLPMYLDIDYWTYYKGEPGLGIKTVQEQYYLSTSNTTLVNGSWEETCPTWVSGRYIWTRSHITWADDSETDTTPTLANGINTANETANDASESVDETNQNVSNLSSRTGALEADIINKVDNADFNDYKEYVVSNYSTINQTSEKISIGIAEATQTLVTKDEYSTTTNQLSEVRSYFDFASNGLTIGKSTSNTTLVLTNEKLSFKLNGQEKAYMSPDSFVLKELKTFKLGGFAFKVRANGNLALVWVGEQE